MARADSLAKLAFAYGVHLTRRRLTRPRSQLAKLLDTYAQDGVRPLLPEERARHPRMTLPDLAISYMRLYARLGAAASDVVGESPDLAAAASACPVGVPLDEVAAIVRRLAGG